MEFDRVTLYRGGEVRINDCVSLKVPTLSDIYDFGQEKYFGCVSHICTMPITIAWQLDKQGIDYTKISDYELFIHFLAPSIDKETSTLLFGDELDFSKMKVCVNEQTKELFLRQHIIKKTEEYTIKNEKVRNLLYKNRPIPTTIETEEYDIIIDRFAYIRITDLLREMHGLKKDARVPKNSLMKKIIIEDSQIAYEEAKDKEFKDNLFPLISTMVNMPGFKHDEVTVFNMNIYAFMDSVKRISKIKTADLLLQSGYSGFGIDLKKIKKNELDYMGELYSDN